MKNNLLSTSSCIVSMLCPILSAGMLLPCCAAADSSLFADGLPVEIKVSEVSRQTIRIELAPLDKQGNPQPATSSPVLVDFLAKEKFRARQLAGEKRIRIGNFRVTIQPKPLVVAVRRADGSLVQELTFNESAGTNLISFRTEASVLGLGEGGDQFDRRGFNFPLINGQRYKLAELGARCFSPFLIGTEGWAMFVSTPRVGFDLRGQRGTFTRQSTAMRGAAGVFVTDARAPADAMREFMLLTGAPVMPPKWALGYMQSHRTLSNEADILAEAKKFRDGSLPCDTFIFLGTGFCPAGWNFGHDSFQFNTNVFSHEATAVIDELHKQHLHIVLHVVPLQADYPTLHGQIPPAPGEELDQRHIANYWERHGDLVRAGVDGWWPDEGDWLDETSRWERHRMYYEGPLSSRPNARPWNLQRNGAPGMTRYGGWIWSGDINSSWQTLAAQVKVGLNSALSLSPFWGTDIGGFFPSRSGEYSGELYARWFEFAAFTPSFRSHGRNWWLHRPWGWNTGEIGPIESRPLPDPAELHHAEVEPVCQKYLNLRYQLMPYTYTITREAHDSGLPLMRALWLHYPRDAEAVKLGDQFLWGRDLLVAPVTEKGATSRRVYLPEGNWFDWWSGEKISGGRWIERPVDLATMPIYVRAGSIVPLDPVRQYISQPASKPTELKIFPGTNGEFTLYDDDGESLGYLKGADSKTVWIHFKWLDATRKLIVEPDKRMKKWPEGSRKFSVHLAGMMREPILVEFRGKRIIVNL
jgi:alpha-glucosidase (family GH31 glycosyl hydrolase)